MKMVADTPKLKEKLVKKFANSIKIIREQIVKLLL